MIYNTDYKENNFENCVAENISYGECNWIEEDMLDLLEESFGPAMISPEYFDKFINGTIEIVSLVQTVKYYKESKDGSANKVLENNELAEKLA